MSARVKFTAVKTHSLSPCVTLFMNNNYVLQMRMFIFVLLLSLRGYTELWQSALVPSLSWESELSVTRCPCIHSFCSCLQLIFSCDIVWVSWTLKMLCDAVLDRRLSLLQFEIIRHLIYSSIKLINTEDNCKKMELNRITFICNHLYGASIIGCETISTKNTINLL